MSICIYCESNFVTKVTEKDYFCNSCKTWWKNENVQDTSAEAKEIIENDGTAKQQRSKVYHLIKNSENGLAISEISKITGLQKSSISPRVNELRKQHLVYLDGYREVNGKRSMVFKTR